MYDIKELKATPGLARRLLAFSQMNKMTFDSKLADLALSGLINKSDLQGFPFELDQNQLSSLQFITDWNGRGMLLCDTGCRGREVALANMWLRGGKTLILSQPKYYHQWAELVQNIYPEAKISVFGNPRYNEKSRTFPKGTEFKEAPEVDADVFITSYGSLIWHNLLTLSDINQTIIEELDHAGAINYKWEDSVKGVFHEVPAPLFIQDINQLPQNAGRSNLASLQANDSKALQFVGDVITSLAWAGIRSMGILTSGFKSKEIEDYLAERGYMGSDTLSLLSLFGVSSHLLDDPKGHKAPIVFHDSTIKDLIRSKKSRSDSGLRRMIDRERELEQNTGLSIEQTVQNALNGIRPSMALIGQLQTTQWANLKSQHLKSIHFQLTNKLTKSLFLTSNPDLKRSLHLNFGILLEDLSTSNDANFTVGRYVYPTLTHPLNTDQWTSVVTGRPLNNLIVSIDDLILQPSLLKVSNFLFVADPPCSQDYWNAIKEASCVTGTRLVNGIILDSFEEIIFKNLL